MLPVKGFEPNSSQQVRGVNGTVQCHPYPYRYRPAKILNRSPPPALYNTVVGSRRHAHATELYRLHLFQLSKIAVLSPPGESRLAPTNWLPPGRVMCCAAFIPSRWLLGFHFTDRERLCFWGSQQGLPRPCCSRVGHCLLVRLQVRLFTCSASSWLPYLVAWYTCCLRDPVARSTARPYGDSYVPQRLPSRRTDPQLSRLRR